MKDWWKYSDEFSSYGTILHPILFCIIDYSIDTNNLNINV